MKQVDVIVVGAGVIGMLTARELQQRGLSVRVFERESVGAASSWAGGGILSPIPPWQASAPVMALAQLSQQAWWQLARTLLSATGVDIEYRRSGVLQLGVTADAAARAWADQTGQPLESLDGPALRDLEPALHPDWQCGLRLPAVAQLRNPRLMRALHADLIARGITVVEGCAVTGLLREAGRVTGVHTDDGVHQGSAVVLAAGAWTGQLLKLPVSPVRGQMLWYRAQPDLIGHILIDRDEYLIPRRDGVVLVGSTVEQAGFDASTTAEAAGYLREVAARLCPAFGRIEPAGQWAGLRPGSPDGIPFIGPHPSLAGLYVNAGHFRNGINLAPASAALLADLLTEATPELDKSPYCVPDRL